MRRTVIHIYGASGSGTTTLGRCISERLGYIFMDTDDYFWLPTDPRYTQKREAAERIALMERDIQASDKAVISGSLVDWGDALIPYFTLAVRIITDQRLRIERLKAREKRAFGSRIEKGGDMYEGHREFLEWAAGYDTGDLTTRSKAKHDEWQKLLTCRQITVNGEASPESNLTLVEAALSANR